MDKPDLARTNWGSEGYFAVVMPRLQDFDQLVDNLTPAEDYVHLYNNQHNCN